MKKPRIITFDLETIWDIDKIANEDVFFSLSNWPGRTMKASIGSIICFGYKVWGEKKPHCINVWDDKASFKANINDDYLVCAAAYEILKDADAIITHNGRRYDFKYLETRLKINGLPSLPPHLKTASHIDTCAVAKASFSMYSNRLKDLASQFTPENKIATGGKKLWTRVYRGDSLAMREMSEYCKQDVVATEALAEAFKPQIKNWPNMNVFMGTLNNCNVCHSTNVQKHGTRPTISGVLRQRFRCMDCGSTSTQTATGKVLRSVS